MNFLALRMLTGLIFSIAFASFLISQQASIFIGLMSRTTSQVIDVVDATIQQQLESDPARTHV